MLELFNFSNLCNSFNISIEPSAPEDISESNTYFNYLDDEKNFFKALVVVHILESITGENFEVSDLDLNKDLKIESDELDAVLKLYIVEDKVIDASIDFGNGFVYKYKSVKLP